jgi:hypothetical protein
MWPRVGVGVGVGDGVTVAGVNSTTTQYWQYEANEEIKDDKTWKRTKKKTVESPRNTTKMRSKSLKIGETVAGVKLNNNTEMRNKANGDTIYVKTCRIFAINTKMRSNSRRIRRNCGWSGTQQQHRKHETGTTNNEQGRKILGPSWNVCSNGHDTEMIHWYYAGLRVLSKNVGITNCRGQLKLYTSVKVGHSRTSIYSIKGSVNIQIQ